MGLQRLLRHCRPGSTRRRNLRPWSDRELIGETLRAIGDEGFSTACDGCASLQAVREQLGLTPEATENRRRQRREQEQEADRRRRTFDVAGWPFEIGATSYGALFGRLDNLLAPEGPRASRDEFTPLTKARSSTGGSSPQGKNRPPTTPRRPSAELRDLAGIVGEMHAYRFLRAEFGNDVVSRDGWVSENRLKVLPLVAGEPNNSGDGHGFDFQFRHRRGRWHVEVKATVGDDPQFDLGISEIKAATRLARERGGRWRILRVRNVLSKTPEFDWLPNPFRRGIQGALSTTSGRDAGVLHTQEKNAVAVIDIGIERRAGVAHGTRTTVNSRGRRCPGSAANVRSEHHCGASARGRRDSVSPAIRSLQAALPS